MQARLLRALDQHFKVGISLKGAKPLQAGPLFQARAVALPFALWREAAWQWRGSSAFGVFPRACNVEGRLAQLQCAAKVRVAERPCRSNLCPKSQCLPARAEREQESLYGKSLHALTGASRQAAQAARSLFWPSAV